MHVGHQNLSELAVPTTNQTWDVGFTLFSDLDQDTDSKYYVTLIPEPTYSLSIHNILLAILYNL